MKTIKFKLGTKEIDNAIKEIEDYKKDIENKTKMVVQRLIELGVDIAQVKLQSLGAYYSGDLLSSIDGYYSPLLNAGFVKVTNDHAAFVEFGTGIVGQNSPHPSGECLSQASWGYATGSKIFTTKDGRVGWVYPSENGEFRFTEGMQSRPFMYETALELERTAAKIVQEVFGK